MSPAPSPLPPSIPPIYLPTKHKQKPPVPLSITAGAEDAKYQTKYKELKRKVKDIESDNDKLHFKVLQAKLSIRRMKMERAILYERIAPSSPTRQDRPLQPVMPQLSAGPAHHPPSRIAPGSHQHLHPSSMDSDQLHGPPEHIRPQPNPRLAAPPASDVRSVPTMDNPAVALSPHMPVHSPRRVSGSHESSRHHLPPMPPQISASHAHSYDTNRAHSLANSHASPPLHHTHPSSSHSRNRSHSSPRSRSQHLPPQPYRGGPGQHHYSESLPPVHQTMHSPPPERERPRRGEPHEYVASHADPHSYDRHQTHLPLSPRIQHSDARSTGRIHSHQRLGPGTYITREEFQDKSRDLEREREWEREHHERERDRNRDYNTSNSRSREMEPSYLMHSPPHMPVSRSRSQLDRGDYDSPHVPPPPPPRSGREEPGGYYHDSQPPPPSSFPPPPPPPPPHPPRLSRSDTPGSGSASGSGAGVADVPSRPDSRSQYYDRERERDRDRGEPSRFRLRPVPQPNEDGPGPVGVGASGSGSGSAAPTAGPSSGSYSMSDPTRPPMDSRKRSRNDMDVDSDPEVGDYSSSSRLEDRSSKRYQQPQHTRRRRSIDGHEDVRMGPP